MGTSVSQASPRNASWQRVFTCYKNKNIPEDRVVAEVWRASDNQEMPLSAELKSETVYFCFNAVENSQSFTEATEKINQNIEKQGGNSITTEFAKRVIPLAFQTSNPGDSWKGHFLSEITKYVVARDASGFVGNKYRNKSISDLVEFKRRIGEITFNKISGMDTRISNISDWRGFVDQIMIKLKNE